MTEADLPMMSTPAESAAAPRRFDLLRWFSIISLVVVGAVAAALGVISTRYVIVENVQRDALLTAQFIQAIAQAEARHTSIPGVRTMGELLDPRHDEDNPTVSPAARQAARGEFLDHIAHLPDVLLANVYAPDRTVIWSTNPALIGRWIDEDDDLEQAFTHKTPVSASYHTVDQARTEQKFPQPPKFIFLENYVPLFAADGETVNAMVEIYKEPPDLIERLVRSLVLIWLTTALGAGLIWLGLFLIMRRAANLLSTQQQRMVANETYVALGEMSSAVAHSLRNPLASIRSSAELAQAFDEGAGQKPVGEIIRQVDRMSGWIRELLQSLAPLNDEVGPVELTEVINHRLKVMVAPDDGVQVSFAAEGACWVMGQPKLLAQIFESLFSNALEAMEQGGTLSVTLDHREAGYVTVSVADTGKGMSQSQQALAFRPFFTTKEGGLGAGLMLVRRIVERQGGSVELSSLEAIGTCVRLRLRGAPVPGVGGESPAV